MLAARDQENLVNSHQTNAANKPLNQSVRGFESKTPRQRAPKTPFRTPFGDENNPTVFGGGKTAVKPAAKDNENCQVMKKDGKLDSHVFVTPIGPRIRAPLGMKTTNAKARAFQTPAPLHQPTKPERTVKKASTTRKSVKSKIRIATSEPVETDILSRYAESDVPDIEYCPPPPIDLPDPPEDITYDDNFPYLRGENLCGGYGEIYDIPRDEHGVSLREREAEKAYAKMVEREFEEKFEKEMAKPVSIEDEDDMVDAMIAAGPKKCLTQVSNVDTIKARRAVSALSSRPPTKLPSVVTRQTASSIQKKKPSFLGLGQKRAAPKPTNPSPMRHSAAIATSRTTLGYTKGRNVSSVLPEMAVNASRVKSGKVEQDQIDPLEFRELYGEPPMGSRMWERFKAHGLFDTDVDNEGDDPAEGLYGMDVHSEEEEDIFQLPVPDDLDA